MDLANDIRGYIDELIDPNADTAQALFKLENKANVDGLLAAELSTLLDLVFEPMVSSMVRNRLLKNCLIPRGDYFISPDVFLRVLGVIGAPEIYYKNGKQHKLKRFSLPTQQRILQWTISILPFFGLNVYSVPRRSLPILFGLLSYEFLRPYIVTLIIIATTSRADDIHKVNCKSVKHSFRKSALRSWHARLTSDLLQRFPLDPSLRLLALHISRSESPLNLHQIFRSNEIPPLKPSEVRIVADAPPVSRLKNTLNDECSQEILRIHHDLLQIYQQVERSAKKRKIDSQMTSRTDLLNQVLKGLQVPISSVYSVTTLISNLENINFINPSSVFAKTQSQNHKYRNLYVSLVLRTAGHTSHIHKKLSAALLHHVLADNSTYRDSGNHLIENFARYDTMSFFTSEMEMFMENSICRANGNMLYLNKQVYFIQYFYLAKTEVTLRSLSSIFACVDKLLVRNERNVQDSFPEFLSGLTMLLSRCVVTDVSGTDEILKSITQQLWDLIEKHRSILNLSCKLSFLMFMNHAVELVTQDSRSWSNPACLIPPPSLMFLLVSSVHPLIVSEALGLIAALKKIKLSEEDILKLAFKNTYVMDSINFVWRDMAFKHEQNTINQGMYLHPYFLQRMNGLDFFSNSNLILTKSVGSIVQNPAFAYISAELVWKLEDVEPGLTMRHPGPISEATVEKIQQDADVKWLGVSYQELKVSLLNHLDAMGFHGIADLLFTSLKPLVGQRTSTRNAL
ncbi:hypothetical protein METBIDRAFT_208792 [Metschnikowia bicuspidata var. bicuspidata NRRL YB-4993]|uniref:Mis6-domain-containing protein n=1 Tax=Metschnikowia bicuspidata var. bicuspidata NRRL YB-4993 TaxID=869754 RepID=A0A1A0H7A1_9ASCO|nr:hypothetical protein METBIDRAFT_208792 [Metschnikowia bicuspidata var. bicuspidata NRRL YB-4993]OBA19855.1 hypothetical protein METBIDRAFT_208792 [Metschnikowia bicuspidata var. bicuspidata NRRL YB-4993]